MILSHRLDRRGAVAAVTGLLMTTLIGFGGLALDLTRYWMVSARLKTAVDAASLLAARQIGQAGRDAQVVEMFWSNWTRNAPSASSRTYLGASVTSGPLITAVDANRVRITASATVPTTLFSVIAQRTDVVTETAVAQRAATGLELALVIDQTSSMGDNAAGGGTKLQAAKAAIQTMLGVLYGSNDAQENFWVSVVPFARTINIGTSAQARAMLTTSGMPAEWSIDAWSGCVEARANGHDITDAAPNSAPFRPFFWASTYNRVGRSSTGSNPLCPYSTDWSSTNDKSKNASDTAYCFGDNDWGPSVNHQTLMANPNYAYLIGGGMTQTRMPGAQASGPNHMCALTPLLPLTASRSTVQAHVNSITAPFKSAGTAILTGLQGAWYTLSPNFQGSWPSTNPTGTPALPLAYNTKNMRKAVVLLSDGEENWQMADAYKPNIRGSATIADLNYAAYGRSADWNARFSDRQISPVSRTNAITRLRTRTAETCAAMKAQGVGITIYVIGFEVTNGSAAETLLKNCATSSQHYFESPTTAQLQSVFTAIANQLTSLRLSE